MKRFTLYLDESGDFEEKHYAPESLVGGYYCPDPVLGATAAKALLDGIYVRHGLPVAPSYHASETSRSAPTKVAALLRDVMRSVWAPGLDGRLAVARNRGRRRIRSPHLTYLHLSAECIVSVLRALIRRHGVDVQLSVVIAKRNVDAEVYKTPISEHVAVTAYRLAFSDLERVSYDLEVADGQIHGGLMVADHICNGLWKGVLSPEDPSFESELARHLLDEVVVENGQSVTLRRTVHEGHYGDAALEAVALISLPGSPLADEARRALTQDIVPGLRDLPSRRREHEFQRLFDSIDVRANLRWEIARGDALLSLIGEHVIEPMRELLREREAWIDFRFHQLRARVANHRGDTLAAREHLAHAIALGRHVVTRWEMLPLWVGLKLDEAVFLTDTCDYDGAVRILDRLDETLGVGIRLLAREMEASAVHADVLGAIYGTRLQAHLFAGRRDPSRYDRARADSNLAMEVFAGAQDLERQYLYRCHAETDAGELVAALGWLGRALHIDDPGRAAPDIAGLVRVIADALGSGAPAPFHLRHYCRLWAAASATLPAADLAAAMAEAWQGLAPAARPPKHDAYVHPWEVIDWKAGVALLRAGKSDGRERLSRATKQCLADDLARPLRPPIYAIGLGCLAEWAALEAESREAARLRSWLRAKTRALLDDRTGRFPDSMRAYFGPWREVVDGAPAPDALLRLARDVAY